MPEEYMNKMTSIGANIIVKDSIVNGEVGIGIWNLTKETFAVIEKITEQDQTTYASLADFLEHMTHPIDQEMVLTGLKKYMENPASAYQSSFRLKGDKRKPKWVLLKGKKMLNPYTGEDIFYHSSAENSRL